MESNENYIVLLELSTNGTQYIVSNEHIQDQFVWQKHQEFIRGRIVSLKDGIAKPAMHKQKKVEIAPYVTFYINWKLSKELNVGTQTKTLEETTGKSPWYWS